MSSSDHPHVLCCADEHYARPMAAMVQSLRAHRAGDLTLTVVDGGISRRTRGRLLGAWEGLDVRWVHPDFAALREAPVTGHASRANYVRLLMEDLLPESVERVLYLDVDLLVLDDVAELWDQPLDGALCLAAQDVGLPHIDPTLAPNFELAREHITHPKPVRNYRELGLDGSAKYLNSGVMLIDLAAWRREGLKERFLRCVRENREHVRLWDQYVLNVVLAGRWKELHPAWNAQIKIHDYGSWEASPYDEATYDEVLAHPRILHFAAPVKPWHDHWPYPYAETFFEYVDQTPWAGWRPLRLPLGFERSRTWRSWSKRIRQLHTWLWYRRK